MFTDGLSAVCKNISASSTKVVDESASAIRFWNTEKRNLLHLSYIFRKTEPLGKEFKTVSCYINGALIFVEAQIGK